MAKVKFKIGALPDFVLPVTFNLPDGTEQKILLTVRHKKTSELDEFFGGEASNTDFVKFIASGWDLEEEFNDENIKELCDLFPSIPMKIPAEYYQALAGNRTKN